MPTGFVTSAVCCCGNLSTVARAMCCHAEGTLAGLPKPMNHDDEPTQKHLFCNYFNEERRFQEFLYVNAYNFDGRATGGI